MLSIENRRIGNVCPFGAYLMLFLISVSFPSCAQETRWIDDIVPDWTLDDSSFEICNGDDQIIQYFNDGKGIQYSGGKRVIDSLFFSGYKTVHLQESGLIRIRFVVNCKGESGRFRILSSDLHYQPFVFSDDILDQLLEITRSMDQWEPKIWHEMKVDYYQYLIFRIENGKLLHILP